MSCLSLKSFHLIHVPWHVACHTFFLAILCSISDTCTQSDDYSFASLPFGESIHCHSVRRVPLWPPGRTVPSHRLRAHVSHRSQQRTHSDQLTFNKSSLDTSIGDLATTLDASETIDTIEVAQFTSPPFSQEREVSANPFSVSDSQAHSSVERPMRDTDLFSNSGDQCEVLSLPSSFDER